MSSSGEKENKVISVDFNKKPSRKEKKVETYQERQDRLARERAGNNGKVKRSYRID